MPTVYIDNQAFEIPEGRNMLEVCLSLGFDLPYFCWHPGMGSVGACRQCAVKQFKDETDTEGRIVMACLTPADDGTRISIEDPDAKEFRRAVGEWLMANHPHDCPVCDEGGECHLQDMTLMTGHVTRRYAFGKRTYRNQDLGPFVNHEMNRCIQCYRCVRFYKDYAGGDDLKALGSRDRVYFGRHADGRLESEFSGNLVEVCPTGVFTDKTFKQHYVRKWDLQTAPSVCVHCGLGCNTIPGERGGILRRIRARYNGAVNGYFLCDRGRFGYAFVNRSDRVRQALLRTGAHDGAGGQASALDRGAAVQTVARLIRDARAAGKQVLGIGSPRASLEANFALRRLVGADGFIVGMAAKEHSLTSQVLAIARDGPSRAPSLRDLEQADAMLILGEDVTNTAPMLAYSLRQWLRNRPTAEQIALKIPEWNDAAVGEIVHEKPSDLHVATVMTTKLDQVALQVYRAAPLDLARLGFAVAHILDPEAPEVPGLSDAIRERAESIARAFHTAKRPVVISGVSAGSQSVLQAAANVAWSLSARSSAAELCLVVPECNSLGLVMMGGRPLADVLDAAREGSVGVLIVLENELTRRASLSTVRDLLAACPHVVVLDHYSTFTASEAEVVLPAATFAECTGTLVNNEGRAQRFVQVFEPKGDVRPSWRWLGEVVSLVGAAEPMQPATGIATSKPARGAKAVASAGADGLSTPTSAEAPAAGIDAAPWRSVDDVLRDLASELPELAGAVAAAPPASYRVSGMKIARQPQRWSGRTAVHADTTMYEPPPPQDPDSPLAFSMEGYEGRVVPSLQPRLWSPGWNSPQALTKYDRELRGEHSADPPSGDAGVRLLEPRPGRPTHFLDVPVAFSVPEETWYLTPIHHIFGSEELSVRAPSIAELAPAPYVALSPGRAARLEVADGDLVRLDLPTESRVLPVRVQPWLPEGVAAIPAGLPNVADLQPPLAAEVIALGRAHADAGQPLASGADAEPDAGPASLGAAAPGVAAPSENSPPVEAGTPPAAAPPRRAGVGGGPRRRKSAGENE